MDVGQHGAGKADDGCLVGKMPTTRQRRLSSRLRPDEIFNVRLEGGNVRAIGFSEGEKLPKVALKTLIREAVNLNEK